MGENREAGADRLVPVPGEGRVYRGTRRVRFGDVDPAGRLRFDALARYMQDVSNDDTNDAGLEDDVAWVVRRTVFEVVRPAGFREMLELATFCGGIGSRWAERRVSITGDGGAAIEAATLWVHVDERTGRPRQLPAQFHELFGAAALGRQVTARLQHPTVVPPDARRRRWPTRATDFDLLGHVNNAASWSLVEEALGDAGIPLDRPHRAELEFRDAIELGAEVELATANDGEGVRLWAIDARNPAVPHLTGLVRATPTG